MKKKTVITTEKHEIWVVREVLPDATPKDQPLDIKTIEGPSLDKDSEESDDLEGNKNSGD